MRADTCVDVIWILTNAESVFELIQGLGMSWELCEDVVNPCGDFRGVVVDYKWTTDRDNDTLYVQNRRLPLTVLLQCHITFDDLMLYEPAPLPTIDVREAFPPPL